MQKPIIQVKNVVKEFTVGGGLGKEDIFRALHGVSFDLYAGKTLALVGESGCGKSTCARLMTKVCISVLARKNRSSMPIPLSCVRVRCQFVHSKICGKRLVENCT